MHIWSVDGTNYSESAILIVIVVGSKSKISSPDIHRYLVMNRCISGVSIKLVVCPIKYDGVSITPTWDYKSQSNSQSHINMTIKLAIKTNGTDH